MMNCLVQSLRSCSLPGELECYKLITPSRFLFAKPVSGAHVGYIMNIWIQYNIACLVQLDV